MELHQSSRLSNMTVGVLTMRIFKIKRKIKNLGKIKTGWHVAIEMLNLACRAALQRLKACEPLMKV